MRFAVPLVVAATVVPSAAITLFARQDIPSCAATCLANANTTCSLTNYSCLCHDTTFLNSTYTCVKSSCSSSEAQEAESAADSLCEQYGVVLTASTTASAAASAIASSASTQHSNGASPTGINSMLIGVAAALAISAV